MFTSNYSAELMEIEQPLIKVSPVMTLKEKAQVKREVYMQLGNTFFKLPKIEEVMEIIKKYSIVTSEKMLRNELQSYFSQMENYTVNSDGDILLSDLINENLIRLKVSAKNWEEAIRKSASALLENDKITANYIDEMINTAKESGPYIVITKHVALPHARPEAGAKEIAIGIATLENPIEFGNKDNDPVKYIFCLSAKDQKTHLEAMSELAVLLEDENFYNVLDNSKTPEEVMDYIKNMNNR
ncbi:PTS sugar transporter subunit IIA [Caloramator sp. E03]|uniref:PTS sugar transporter subunit IIA n=1 Tax=Caloramator sp. E03 TaxID=2576307 RepID=UPI001FAAF886|nr:PTS sugar transporter subunit IIA [Caloramator sp. E03]